MKFDKEHYIKELKENKSHAIENTVIQCICETIEILDENITTKTELSDLSINSLTFVSIIVKLEEAFDIELDDSCLNSDNFENIGQLVDIVKDNLLKI